MYCIKVQEFALKWVSSIHDTPSVEDADFCKFSSLNSHWCMITRKFLAAGANEEMSRLQLAVILLLSVVTASDLPTKQKTLEESMEDKVLIKLCVSWYVGYVLMIVTLALITLFRRGYRKNFSELKNFLEKKYPHLIDRVFATNFPPPTFKQHLATAISWIQMSGLALLVLGDSVSCRRITK